MVAEKLVHRHDMSLSAVNCVEKAEFFFIFTVEGDEMSASVVKIHDNAAVYCFGKPESLLFAENAVYLEAEAFKICLYMSRLRAKQSAEAEMAEQISVHLFNSDINAVIAEEIPGCNPAAAVFAGEITAVFHVGNDTLIDDVAVFGK